jgi:type 1 glutamine amidotransferase
MRLLTFLLVAGCLALTNTVSAGKPVRVLLVLCGKGGPGGAHDINLNPPHLEKVLKAAGGVEVSRLAPPAGNEGDAAHLAKLADLKPGDYDVLVFYTVGQSLDARQEAALQSFVEAGGGVVAIHGASASFGNSMAWFKLIGGRFAGHAAGTFPLTISITDADHPVTRGLKEFEIRDEEYTHRFPEGVERRVLARFKERPANTVEKNANNDVIWTINAGKGRVVYNALGHDEESWKNPSWLKLTAQSVFWAAGRPREVRVEP